MRRSCLGGLPVHSRLLRAMRMWFISRKSRVSSRKCSISPSSRRRPNSIRYESPPLDAMTITGDPFARSARITSGAFIPTSSPPVINTSIGGSAKTCFSTSFPSVVLVMTRPHPRRASSVSRRIGVPWLATSILMIILSERPPKQSFLSYLGFSVNR